MPICAAHLSLIRELADEHGIARLRGIGNAAHPFGDRHDRTKADREGCWLESAGTELAHGWYELPISAPPRDQTLIQSKHRSALHRREALRQHGSSWQAAA